MGPLFTLNGEDGYWVMGWCFVSQDEIEQEDEEENEEEDEDGDPPFYQNTQSPA